MLRQAERSRSRRTRYSWRESAVFRRGRTLSNSPAGENPATHEATANRRSLPGGHRATYIVLAIGLILSWLMPLVSGRVAHAPSGYSAAILRDSPAVY